MTKRTAPWSATGAPENGENEMAAADFEILDDRFVHCVKTSATVEQLFTGCRWAEGPAYFPAGRYLVWSDIPNDRMLRWDETTGVTGVFRHPAGYTNGHAVDREGRLVSCEHGGRRVSRTEHDGTVVTIADSYQGKRLNSPNDVVVKSDGSIWFTDPAYGIDSDYEGSQAESEIDGCHVYRVDPVSGDCEIVADDFVRPNGIGFSPDEKRLYVSDTGASHVSGGPKHIRLFDVDHDGTLSNGRVFAECTVGFFDGFRCDTEGRVWASADDGVHCYDPDGTLIGKVLVPETVANVEFGGPKRNRLFICGTSSLYSVMLPVNGARRW
jgi:gluconolactonase